ncbi:hypothetical protein TSMEX_001285 [Taenia solium]|eukprot:TsM_000605900 transcript=TsM_000605900 gene=TsM_000605900
MLLTTPISKHVTPQISSFECRQLGIVNGSHKYLHLSMYDFITVTTIFTTQALQCRHKLDVP